MAPKRLLLNVDETSQITGIPPKRLYDRALHGLVPGVIRIGRTVRFSLPVILRWIQAEEPDGDRDNAGASTAAASECSHK
jgi:hypothetical protein